MPMATDTLPTFWAEQVTEGEPQFVVSYPYEGVKYVVGFSSFMDLLHVVTSYKNRWNEPLDGRLINLIVDFAEESLEWNARPPVAEAVSDEPCGDQQLAELRSDLRSQGRLVVWGVVAAVVIGLLF